MKTIRIGQHAVGEGHPCYVIAEAGVNHNGRLDLAKQLVEVAADAGVQAIKFQKRTVRDILIQEALEEPYDKIGSFGATYGEHREHLELSDGDYRELFKLSQGLGLTFLASAWDVRSADFLEELGVPAFKIASAGLTNIPLIDHISRKGKPTILSTGMSDLAEVTEAVETVRKHHDELVLLQCTSLYPTNNDQIHLRVMETLRREFEVLVGYSGHERGIAISVAAVALGAVIVERHFTLDRSMPGPDHAASLEPHGLKKLVRDIRNIEAAMGSPDKKVLDKERSVRARLAKSVVARQDIPAGTRITLDMLTVKGPGTGLPPYYLHRLEGVLAPHDIRADTLIPPEAVEWER
ncbi:MAG: N-acetylneuraminate synthase family protein [bacterium]|nr:N-acetylneuraminate synthase family protein [bacterium]